MKSADEQRLLGAAGRGDESAFHELYRHYRGYVLAVAARYGVTGDGALDVLQETFLYVFRKLPDFEYRAKFSTFLYPVVRNLSLKRKADRKRHLSPGEGGPDLPSLPAGPSAANGIRKTIDMVSSLPKEQREVVLLRFVDGLSLKEISLAIDIPLGTVKSRLHHALVSLRLEHG